MIGEKQLFPFYSSSQGFSISSASFLYDLTKKEDVFFLNEKMKLVPCTLKYYGEQNIRSLYTNDNTVHHFYDEKIIINGVTTNSNEATLGDYIYKYMKPNIPFDKRYAHKLTENKSTIKDGYYVGLLIGLIYLYGAVSSQKIAFMISKRVAETTNGKIETFERMFDILLSTLEIDSYKKTLIEKNDDDYYIYEIFLNLKVRKILNEILNKYINSYTKKFIIKSFLENHLFLQGFLDIAFKKVELNKFSTTNKQVAVEVFNLANIFGYNMSFKKDNLKYIITVDDNVNTNFILGVLHNKITKVELNIQKIFELIPNVKNSDNIFITGSKTLIDKR